MQDLIQNTSRVLAHGPLLWKKIIYEHVFKSWSLWMLELYSTHSHLKSFAPSLGNILLLPFRWKLTEIMIFCQKPRGNYTLHPKPFSQMWDLSSDKLIVEHQTLLSKTVTVIKHLNNKLFLVFLKYIHRINKKTINKKDPHQSHVIDRFYLSTLQYFCLNSNFYHLSQIIKQLFVYEKI